MLAVVIASVAVAAAEPAKPAKPTKPTTPAAPKPADDPPIAIDLGPHPHPHDPSTRSPGLRGLDAFGRIVVPDPHPDARPYPEGMVITPAEPGDRNVLVPGGNQLPWWAPSAPRPTAQVLDRFERGLGEVLRWLIPQPS